MNFSSIIRRDHKVFYKRKFLLYSRGFVIEVALFIQRKNFRWRKVTKFPNENFCPMKVLPTKFSLIMWLFFRNLLLRRQKYTLWSMSMQRLWLSLIKLHSLEILKMIETRTLILKLSCMGENSFLQMYGNNISFLTYWLLRIKWLFPKSVKIT